MSKEDILHSIAHLNNDEKRKIAVEILLGTLGEDINREGLKDTPKRVSKMYDEIFAGYAVDPVELLQRTFTKEDHHEMVIVQDIKFYSACEHHMVPFFGKVHIGYIPNGTVVGISKLARLVQCFAQRLQIQERMTTQIADTIMQVLHPMGVGVIVEASHLCMVMRGAKSPEALTKTAAMRGVFLDKFQVREEFYNLIGR